MDAEVRSIEMGTDNEFNRTYDPNYHEFRRTYDPDYRDKPMDTWSRLELTKHADKMYEHKINTARMEHMDTMDDIHRRIERRAASKKIYDSLDDDKRTHKVEKARGLIGELSELSEKLSLALIEIEHLTGESF